MAYEVIWLPKAEIRFEEIIDYLKTKWTEREVENFIKRTWQVISIISDNPYLYRYSAEHNTFEAILTKHNLLLYHIKNQRIELLTFFDTRQHPKKKKG